MQHPVTYCETKPCIGYEKSPPLIQALEELSREYPLLKTNQPMKIFPMTEKEFSAMINGGYIG